MISQTNYMNTFTTLSDLTGGRKYSEDEIIEFISKMNLGGVLVILSQMSSYGRENIKIRKLFFEYLNKNNIHGLEDAIGSQALYSEQGLLSLWKWIFVHGKEESLNASVDTVIGINQIIHLCIAVSDYLYEKKTEEEVAYYLFSNAVFNNKADLGADLARAVIIFDEIAQDRDHFIEKEFLDLHTTFFEKYGYSIREYLAIIFGLISGFIDPKNKKQILKIDWNKSENYFENIQNPALGRMIINELSMSFSEAQAWSQTTLSNSWDFTKFRQKPLIRLNNGNFYPINLRFLFDKMLNDLYFKIREAFPSDTTQVISFYGRCFEKYVEILTRECIEPRKKKLYDFIPEFTYGNGKKRSNRSPDVMLRLGDTLLAIEAKVYRLKMNSLFGVADSIDKDVQRIAESPILQLHKRLSELHKISHPSIKGVSKIYLMSVTFGDFPTLKPFEDKIIQSFGNFQLPIAGCFHLDIEEYEMLMEIISRDSSLPIFKYLENKQRIGRYMSFKNFLFGSHLHPKRSFYIEARMISHLQSLRNMLFASK